jgi:hypothetical protein
MRTSAPPTNQRSQECCLTLGQDVVGATRWVNDLGVIALWMVPAAGSGLAGLPLAPARNRSVPFRTGQRSL